MAKGLRQQPSAASEEVMPQDGGSYVRDTETGALTCIEAPPRIMTASQAQRVARGLPMDPDPREPEPQEAPQ